MNKKLYIIVLLLLSFSYVNAQRWQHKIINYDRSEYKAGHQTWMIEQSSDGWMYFANSNGLLEYDGNSWNLYPIENDYTRCLKIIDNKIYVGGLYEFGFFERNKQGVLKYTILSDQSERNRDFVWNILYNNEKIYFVEHYKIKIYGKDNKPIKTVTSKEKIDCSIFYNNKLYAGTPNGIYTLDSKEALQLVKNSESLIGAKIVSILPYNDKLLITTAQRGLFFLDNEGISPISSSADEFISKNQLFCTAILGNKIALGSVQSGAFIFDLNNKDYKEIYNLDNGLKANTVLDCYFDKDGSLWLGMDKGLTHIEIEAPLYHLFSSISPIGSGYCSQTYNGQLYLGTNQGLYRLFNNNDYELIQDSQGQIWSMNVIDNTLFSCGDNGLIAISESGPYKVDILEGVWSIKKLKDEKDRLLVGTYTGLAIIKKENNRWVLSHYINLTPKNEAKYWTLDSSRSIMVDDNSHVIWLVNANRNIQRIVFDEEYKTVIEKKEYKIENSFIHKNSFFRKIDNKVVVCAVNGIYQYSKVVDSFVHYKELESRLNGPIYYEYLYADKKQNIWYVNNGKLNFLPYRGGYNSNSINIGLSNALIANFENVQLADDNWAIVATDNGFVKINLKQMEERKKKINVFIRKLITSKNDSIIWQHGADTKVSIPYAMNSIKFNFVATDLNHNTEILYSYRLKGHENEWSTPCDETVKEYSNLSEGNYTFEVKITVDGIEQSNIANVKFNITPPWYRSIPAYLVYILLIALLFFFIYKQSIKRQQKIIQQKKQELITKTKQFEEDTKLKDQEISNLQYKNMKIELHYKAQEINGYILNLKRKNKILEDIKKNAVSIVKSVDEDKQLSIIKQKAIKLVAQINSNLERDIDFKVFESNFNIIHQDFFNLLDEQFPGLTKNEKILCAYLKMDLSSKEIAPILNISVRSVEVNRYRLRKKLNLDRDVSLTDYFRRLKKE